MLILIPFGVCALVFHLLSACCKRAVGCSCKRAKNINTGLKVTQEPGAFAEQLPPQAGWWGGDIIGYFAYLKGWTKFLHKNAERNGTVFQVNIGCPALALLDAGSSSAAIFQGTNGATVAHAISLRFSRSASSH